MTDCDYCGDSFDGEDAYLDHLADAHEGKLGPIDRRRVQNRGGDGDGEPFPIRVVAGGLVVVLAVAGAAFVLLGGVSPDGIEARELAERGDPARLSAVESFPSEGATHVQQGTDIDYARTPPLSGPHYTSTVDAGFYEEPQSYGALVHSLEHGAVVVYYDPSALSDSAEQSLKEYAAANTGPWRSVIVVPNPESDPAAPFVLTAWRHRLYMDSYSAETVYAFLSEFLGRGPENPVR